MITKTAAAVEWRQLEPGILQKAELDVTQALWKSPGGHVWKLPWRPKTLEMPETWVVLQVMLQTSRAYPREKSHVPKAAK